MKILRSGDRGEALAPGLGRVPIVFRYQPLVLDSGVVVPNVLVGIHEPTGRVLVVPAQSTPRIKEARDRRKEVVIEVRVPRELEDILAVLADHFTVSPKKFSPALVRYYLRAASEDPELASRLRTLSATPLARSHRAGRLKIRCDHRLVAALDALELHPDAEGRSQLVRGAIIAAKQDILDRPAAGRAEMLRAVAAAI